VDPTSKIYGSVPALVANTSWVFTEKKDGTEHNTQTDKGHMVAGHFG